MESLFNSFLMVTVAEIGDKTQLLSLLLIQKFKKPWPIIWGILFSTIANHYMAAWLGGYVVDFLPEAYRTWILAAIFIIFAFWILIPDSDEDLEAKNSHGAFITTFILFFLAEMGDKTQLATVALGAQYQSALMVTIGSTLGMLAANVPAVFMGQKLLKVLPLKWIRYFTSLLFFVFAVYIIMS